MPARELVRVPNTLWHNLGTTYTPEDSILSEDLIKKARFNYTISSHTMSSDLEARVGNYKAIYRDDTNSLLGVVNRGFVNLVQYEDTFKVVEPLLMDKSITVETVAGTGGSGQLFGVFKINEEYTVLNDDLANYIIVVNDPLKPDGKVQVLNTPIRIACMNAFSYALSQAAYSARYEVSKSEEQLKYISSTIIGHAESSVHAINKVAENLVKKQIDDSGITKVIDSLFPYVEDPSGEHDRANDAVDAQREAFKQCLDADDLQNYKGTAFSVFNAVTDFTNHYFTDATRYDIGKKITLLPGIGTPDVKIGLVKKALNILNAA